MRERQHARKSYSLGFSGSPWIGQVLPSLQNLHFFGSTGIRGLTILPYFLLGM